MRNRINFIGYITCLTGLVALTACSNNSSSTSDKSGALTAPIASSKSLLGDWESPCRVYDAGPLEAAGSNWASFTDTTVTMTASNYNNKDCSGDAASITVLNGTYSAKPSATDISTLDFDAQIQSVTQTFMNQTHVVALNASKYCGFNDWKVGVAKQIVGLACASGFANGVPTYSIIKVGDSTIQPGEPDSDHNGLTPGKRHAALGKSVFNRK